LLQGASLPIPAENLEIDLDGQHTLQSSTISSFFFFFFFEVSLGSCFSMGRGRFLLSFFGVLVASFVPGRHRNCPLGPFSSLKLLTLFDFLEIEKDTFTLFVQLLHGGLIPPIK
jgi:hypothetical protein